MQLAITEMSSKQETITNPDRNIGATRPDLYNGEAYEDILNYKRAKLARLNNKIGVNTEGFIKGAAEAGGFEIETVFTEALHNGMLDVPESKEFRCSRYVDKRGRKWIVFANDGIGISVDELMMMQEMATYKGARKGKTGKYGLGLVALRSKITGDVGDVHMMSLKDDVSSKYDDVDEFIADMRDGGANNTTGDARFGAIHYNMEKVLSKQDETIKCPEDLPSVAAQLWKNGSVDPLKPGTLLAYQSTDECWELLEEQLKRKIMDYRLIKYNLIYTADIALKAGKKLRWFDGSYLKAIPSLEDYNRHLGGVQIFTIEGEVSHKKQKEDYSITITRKENQAFHKFIEVSPSVLADLPIEASTPGNKKYDREDKKNVLKYIIQEVNENGRVKKDGKTFMLGVSNENAGVGAGMYEMKLKKTKIETRKLVTKLEKEGADVEFHTATAVYDTRGYINWIQPVLDENGLRMSRNTREMIYPTKSIREGAVLREERRDLNQDYGKVGTAAYLRVGNKHSFRATTNGDKKRRVKGNKWKLGSPEYDLMKVRQYIEHKKNKKLFGAPVDAAIKGRTKSLKFQCDIKENLGVCIDDVIDVRVNNENKRVKLIAISAASPTAKYANVALSDDTGGALFLTFTTCKNSKKNNTLKKAITDYKNWEKEQQSSTLTPPPKVRRTVSAPAVTPASPSTPASPPSTEIQPNQVGTSNDEEGKQQEQPPTEIQPNQVGTSNDEEGKQQEQLEAATTASPSPSTEIQPNQVGTSNDEEGKQQEQQPRQPPQQSAQQQDSANLDVPTSTHKRDATQVSSKFNRGDTIAKIDDMLVKFEQNRLSDEQVNNMLSPIIRCRNDIAAAYMDGNQVQLLLAMLNHRTSTLGDYLFDLKLIIENYKLHGENVKDGGKINNIYREYVLNADN